MTTSAPDREEQTGADLRCVLTRFEFKSTRHLLRMRRRYHAMAAEAERLGVPGLRQSALLFESPTACFSLTIWDGLPLFSANMPSHIHAANSVFGSLVHDESGPRLWSTSWQLDSVSGNRNWPGCDLTDAVALGGVA